VIRKPFFRDERGAAVIELALVAPILAALTAGIIDLSTAYSRKLAFEQGAQRAIEKIMQTTDDNTVEGTLKQEAICQVNGQNTDGSCGTSPITAADITVLYKLICRTTAGVAGSTQSNTDPAVFDTYTCTSAAPVENRDIDVTISKNFQGIFIHKFWGNGSSFPITASAGMRTQ
jgi:Flp pilus assembly protein TadG